MAEKKMNKMEEENMSGSEQYVCSYCGQVNPIDAVSCKRCGKRRPRSEYLKAMEARRNAEAKRQELAAAEAANDEAIRKQVDKMVEERLEQERTEIIAQEEMRLESERENIKKAAARDAVLKVIATENEAQEQINDAEKKAREAMDASNREVDAKLAAEREKILDAASEKVVAERAGIEEAARERVEANREAVEKYATENILLARDAAERVAARQAVLQIINAEQQADEKLRLSRNAMQQAAVERIVEERILADKEAAARYAAEKQAIERAADERIRAERRAVERVLGYAPQTSAPNAANNGQTVQPFAIVPYVNANQPVYQYNPNRVVYRFYPDQVQPQQQPQQLQQPMNMGMDPMRGEVRTAQYADVPQVNGKKGKKKKK